MIGCAGGNPASGSLGGSPDVHPYTRSGTQLMFHIRDIDGAHSATFNSFALLSGKTVGFLLLSQLRGC